MSDIAVIYKSKYGSTKTYATWIADELSADLFEVTNIKPELIEKYNTIIYGGGLYASGINGISFLTQNFDKFINKNIIVFTVGIASTEDKTIFLPIIDKNFKSEIKDKIHIFHLRGGIDYKNLSFVHKSMMAMLIKLTKNKNENELSNDDKMMLETYGQKVDFTDKNSISPIILYVKSL